MKEKIKAVSLLSGGLDSILAARVIMDQGIDVTGIFFSAPFWSSSEKEDNLIKKAAEENGMEVMIIPVGEDYLDIIKNPKHGWGKHINPCIDCKIYMLQKAKEIMEKIGASFVVTGEVLGQRPMSQQKNSLNLIEKESGLKGRLVRALSAKLLDPTEPEIKGILDREKLADISGRTRKMQYELAKKYKVNLFSSPAGGCLLTEKIFEKRFKDLLKHNKDIKIDDITFLKYGRHYRFNDSKIIVGRNEKENEFLLKNKYAGDLVFEVPEIGSPNTLLQGNKSDEAIKLAARLTALYSDSLDKKIEVLFGEKDLSKKIKVSQITKEEANKYNISL